MIKMRDSSINTIEEYICKNLSISSIDELNVLCRYSLNKEAYDAVHYLLEKHKNSPIIAVGDYDVDGITSACEWGLIFKEIGITNYSFRFPKRMSEGYGLSDKIVNEVLERKPSLVILFDNGITSVEAVSTLRDAGIDVLIVDHHIKRDDGKIPCANYIINPHVIDNQSDFIDYCTAGLVYKIAEGYNLSKKTMDKILSFAAIGTVSDLVTIVKDNRQIVKAGLKTLTSMSGRTTGLYYLLKKLYLAYNCNEDDIGYKIGPCINAYGRLDDNGAEFVFKALSIDDVNMKEEAERLANVIFEKNEERKLLVKHFIPIIEKQIKETNQEDAQVIIACGNDIPEGIIGILAGHITEKYKNVAIVFSKTENGILKGSGRAYQGTLHLKDTLDKCKDTIIKFGGHEGAAGLSVKEEMYSAFCNKIKIVALESAFKADHNTYYDFEIEADNIPSIADKLYNYAPFGMGNPNPVFYIKNYKSAKFEFFEKNKAVCKITDKNGVVGFSLENGEDFKDLGGIVLNAISQIRKLDVYGGTETKFLFNENEYETVSISLETETKEPENPKKEEPKLNSSPKVDRKKELENILNKLKSV